MYILNYLGYYSTKIIHTGIISFIIVGPFIIKSRPLLLNHVTLSSTILLHWKLNNDACSLTLLEQYFRKSLGKSYNKNECFSYKIIAPFYNFNKNYEKYNYISYATLSSLCLVSHSKLLYLRKDGIIEALKKNNFVFGIALGSMLSVLFAKILFIEKQKIMVNYNNNEEKEEKEKKEDFKALQKVNFNKTKNYFTTNYFITILSFVTISSLIL